MENINALIIKECKIKGITFKKAENFFVLKNEQVYMLSKFAKQVGFKRKTNTSSKSTVHLFYEKLKRYNNKK